jgi:co-chaperonin GroES (HSP10)
MITHVPKDFVLVKLEKKSENEYRFSSGLIIHIDTSFKPTHYQRIYADVVAIPLGLREDGDLVKWDNEDPKRLDSIVQDVLPGDRIYFNYTALNNYAIIEYDGVTYYKINYASIICTVRDIEPAVEIDIDAFDEECKRLGVDFNETITEAMNTMDIPFGFILTGSEFRTLEGYRKITPIGGHVLLTEYLGQGIEKETIGNNNIYVKKSKSGLIMAANIQPVKGAGIVRFISKPLIGDTINISDGDIVLYPKAYGFKNTIEDKEYICVKYFDIHAIVGKENDYCII